MISRFAVILAIIGGATVAIVAGLTGTNEEVKVVAEPVFFVSFTVAALGHAYTFLRKRAHDHGQPNP